MFCVNDQDSSLSYNFPYDYTFWFVENLDFQICLALIEDPASSVILEFEHNRNIVIDIVIIKKFGTTYLVFRFVKM